MVILFIKIFLKKNLQFLSHTSSQLSLPPLQKKLLAPPALSLEAQCFFITNNDYFILRRILYLCLAFLLSLLSEPL